MYKIDADGLLIYHPLMDEYRIKEGSLELGINAAGTLSFTLTEDNPHWGMIDLMKTTVTLYDDERVVFRGRAYSPGLNLYKDRKIVCEGELAFFNDSLQEPMNYTGNAETLFRKIIDAHNSQVSEDRRFNAGEFVVGSENPEDEIKDIIYTETEYKTTWDTLKALFTEAEPEMYLVIRHEDDGIYIDCRDTLPFLGKQSICQSINLIEAEEEVTCDELATALIPLGARKRDDAGNETDEYLTIESVNNGVKYVFNEEGVEEYGWIFKTMNFDDIDDPEELKRAGEKYIAQSGVYTSVEISAADLSRSDVEVSPFILGTYVDVKIANLDIDRKMLIKSMSINLLAPGEGSITVGDKIRTLTAGNVDNVHSIGKIENNIDSGFRHNQIQINEVIRDTATKIEQTEEKIMGIVSEDYYLKEDADELIQSVETRFEQTAEEFEFLFSGMRKDIDDLLEDSSAEFDAWKKYIRFRDGNIILGEEGNEIELVIENDRISFRQNNAEVAYLSNAKLTVTDGEFLNSLRIGSFAFSPRENGNLSFKKVG